MFSVSVVITSTVCSTFRCESCCLSDYCFSLVPVSHVTGLIAVVL